MSNDPVNHPSHYTQGKIECIDFITDKKLNFCRGNAVKYIVRAGLKDPSKEIEDLEKAVFYLNREIQDLKGIMKVFPNCPNCVHGVPGIDGGLVCVNARDDADVHECQRRNNATVLQLRTGGD